MRLLTRLTPVIVATALLATGGLVLAQKDNLPPDTSNAPVDASGSFEVTGVQVDVTAPNADAARYAGWRMAQRKGWQLLAKRFGKGGSLSDGALDGIVTGIVIESEQIGPNRYVAKLGVLFSRSRAGAILGVATGVDRSAPILVLPIEVSGGVATAFEQQTQWDQAWARFRTGESQIDYVRPAGNGPDLLLLNAGQAGRRDRGWWRLLLDQYGASDVLISKVTLYRSWPGGPVVGVFEARHGPDDELVGRFILRVASSDSLPALLDAGVRRMDEIYQNSVRSGTLSADPGLSYIPPADATPTPSPTPTDTGDRGDDEDQTPGVGGAGFTIQAETPSAAAVASTESALRGIPGVSGAATDSLAIGGISVMRLSFNGSPEALRAALEARGYQVSGSGTTLRIRRVAPSLPPPDVSDNSISG